MVRSMTMTYLFYYCSCNLIWLGLILNLCCVFLQQILNGNIHVFHWLNKHFWNILSNLLQYYRDPTAATPWLSVVLYTDLVADKNLGLSSIINPPSIAIKWTIIMHYLTGLVRADYLPNLQPKVRKSNVLFSSCRSVLILKDLATWTGSRRITSNADGHIRHWQYMQWILTTIQ